MTIRHPKSNLLSVSWVGSLGVLIFAFQVARAGPVSWTGNGASGAWTDAANWAGANCPPGPADDVTFGDAENRNVTVNVDATIGTLTFNSIGPYAFSGSGTLTLGGAVTQEGAGAVLLGNPVATGDVPRSFGGTGGGKVTIAGQVTGGGLLTFAGSSYCLSDTDNSYTNGTEVTGGVLELLGPENGDLQVYYMGYDSLVGSGMLRVNGGELRLTPRGTGKVGQQDTGFRKIRYGSNGGTLKINGALNVKPLFSFQTTEGATAPAVVQYSTIANAGGPDKLQGWDLQWRALRVWSVENTGPLRLEMTNGALAWFADPSSTSPGRMLTVQGQPDGDASAPSGSTDVGRFILAFGSNMTVSFGELSLQDAVQVSGDWGTHTLDSNIRVRSGAVAAFQGVSDKANTGYNRLILGTGENATLTVEADATAIMDVRFRTDLGSMYTGGVTVKARTVIDAGGALRFKQTISSGTPAPGLVGYIRVDGDIVGQGNSVQESVVDLRLPFGDTNGQLTGGVSFGPACDLVVQGSGTGGMRIGGSMSDIGNLLSVDRITRITGAGGYLTIAPTDQAFTLSAQWADHDVGLKVVDSNPAGDDILLGTDLDRNVWLEPGAMLNTAGYSLSGKVEGSGSVTGAVSVGGTVTGSVSIAGPVTIEGGGTVVLGADGQIAPTAPVTVKDGGMFNLNGHTDTSQCITLEGGVLMGSGTTSAVTVGAGGTISPGASIGTMATGDELWRGGGVYWWEVGAGGSDLIRVVGDLQCDGTTVLKVISYGSGLPGNGDYVLFDVSGVIQGMSDWVVLPPNGWTCDGVIVQGNQVILANLTVPEPATLSLLALGGLVLLRRRRESRVRGAQQTLSQRKPGILQARLGDHRS